MLDDRDQRLIRIITEAMEEWGLPEFSDHYPAMDILQLIKNAGYKRLDKE